MRKFFIFLFSWFVCLSFLSIPVFADDSNSTIITNPDYDGDGSKYVYQRGYLGVKTQNFIYFTLKGTNTTAYPPRDKYISIFNYTTDPIGVGDSAIVLISKDLESDYDVRYKAYNNSNGFDGNAHWLYCRSLSEFEDNTKSQKWWNGTINPYYNFVVSDYMKDLFVDYNILFVANLVDKHNFDYVGGQPNFITSSSVSFSDFMSLVFDSGFSVDGKTNYKSPYFYLTSTEPEDIVSNTKFPWLKSLDRKQVQYRLSWNLPKDWSESARLRIIVSTSTRENGYELLSVNDDFSLHDNKFFTFFMYDDVTNALSYVDDSWRPVPSAMFNVYVSGNYTKNGGFGTWDSSDKDKATHWTRFTCYANGSVGNVQGQDYQGNPTIELKTEKGTEYTDGTKTDDKGRAESVDSKDSYDPEKHRETSSTGTSDIYTQSYQTGEDGKLDISKTDFDGLVGTLKDCAYFVQNIITLFGQVLSFIPSYIISLIFVGIAIFIVLGILRAIRG